MNWKIIRGKTEEELEKEKKASSSNSKWSIVRGRTEAELEAGKKSGLIYSRDSNREQNNNNSILPDLSIEPGKIPTIMLDRSKYVPELTKKSESNTNNQFNKNTQNGKTGAFSVSTPFSHIQKPNVNNATISNVPENYSAQSLIKPKQPKSNLEAVTNSIGYGLEKIGAGALSGIENAGDFLTAGAAKLLSGITGLGGLAPNPVSDKMNDIAKSQLAKKDLGTMWSENIEKRYAVPDVVRKYAGVTLENAGNMALPIIAEIVTGGVSPALDMELAKQASNIVNTTGKISKIQKAAKLTAKGLKDFYSPSSALFGLSAAGSAASQGYEKSGDVSKSLVYGVLSGTGEMATEKIFGGFAGTDIGDSIIDFTINNKALRKALNFGSEAVEEMIMTAVDPIFQKATVDKDAAFASISDYKESALGGILLSAFMGSAIYPFQRYAKNKSKKEFADILNTQTAVLNYLTPEQNPIKPLDIDNLTDDIISSHQQEIKERTLDLKDDFEKEIIENSNQLSIESSPITSTEQSSPAISSNDPTVVASPTPIQPSSIQQKAVESIQTATSNNDEVKKATIEGESFEYEIVPSVHTQTKENLFVVRLKNHIENFNALRDKIKEMGGYYAPIQKGFVFKENPAEKLAALSGGVDTEPAIEAVFPVQENLLTQTSETTMLTQEIHDKIASDYNNNTISAGSVSRDNPQHPTYGQNIPPNEPVYNSVDNIIPQNNDIVNSEKQLPSFMKPYTQQEKENLTNTSKNLVDGYNSTMQEFVDYSTSNSMPQEKTLYLGKITDTLAKDIFSTTSVNVSDYSFVITNGEIRKIFKDHGNPNVETPRGQIAITPEILCKLPEVAFSPDKVSFAPNPQTDAGKPVLQFEKRINGYAIYIQAVSDKGKKLRPITFYVINKKKPPTMTNVVDNNPAHHVQNASGTASDSIIPQNSEIVNEEIVQENPLENNSKSDIIQNTADSTVQNTIQNSGAMGVAYTSDNKPIDFKYAIVPASELIVSHEADGTLNPSYPQELQPRNRERYASQKQINDIANNLNPALLGESSTVVDGAPIVGQDGIVESGNGRIIALKEVFKSNPAKADEYNRYIKDNAEKFGINSDDISKDSVLVRVRTDNGEIDRAEFTRKANESSVSSYSASEVAVADAKKLTPEILDMFSADSDGDLLSVDNRAFIKRFINDVVPASEQNRCITGNGNLTQEGLTRIRNALFQKAYGDTALLEKFSESLDDDTKNLTRALLNVAPKIVQLDSQIKNGSAYPINISSDITEAARLYDTLKANGMTVDGYDRQMSIDDKASDDVISIARAFERNKRSAKAIGEYIGSLLDNVEALGDPNQVKLINDETTVTKSDIIRGVEKNSERDIIEEDKPVSAEPSSEQISPSAKDKNISQTIANFVKEQLADDRKLTINGLFITAAREYGGTMANNAFTPKDAYDAMELGVNQHILNMKDISLESVQKILDLLPTQTKRTEGMDKFQQFSTPPSIAYLANYAANIDKNDTMLEPSAGIGGIAAFAKKDGATVYVNELDPRRLEILKNMPFDEFFNEDAEQINNIIGDKISPTVVVMNPPFSSSGTRNVHDTKIGAKHIEQALKILAPNGRLVAIVGQGMSDNAPAFKDWWRKIKSEYNVRANVEIDGTNYTKYGTNFGIQMLVIDKDGATIAPTKTAFVKDLSELQNILREIRDDRTRISTKNEPRAVTAARKETTGGSGDRNIQRTAASDASGGADTRNIRDGEPKRIRNVERNRTVADNQSQNANDDTVELHDDNTDNERGLHGRGNTENIEQRHQGEDGTADVNDKSGGTDGRTDRQSSEPNTKNRVRLNTPKKKELTDNIFEPYQPHSLLLDNVRQHPANISESAAMSAVEPPTVTYKPNLDQSIIDKGILSDVQLEAVTYAGQSHRQKLPDGTTRAFFLGDGTGVGKGRTIAGVIRDSFNNGSKKAIWVSENKGLLTDAQRDVEALFGSSELVTEFEGGKKADKILKKDRAILFATYSGISKEYTKKESNFDKIVKWLGKDFDGVIVFDEAHNMGNSTSQSGSRGKTKASQKGLAGVELQKVLPNAKIVYSSATGATNVENLRYAERLGLWGEGTPFINGEEFVTKIKAGGLAAMELIARDMKAMGVYLSRNISYEDVKYDRLTHKLTNEQHKIYNELARSWQIVLKNINEALKTTNQNKNGNAKGAAYSAFWGSQQRFFNQIMTAMQVPSMIEDIQKQLDKGNSIVIQLVSTNEAAQEEEMSRIKKEELDLEEFDLTPRQMLMSFIEKSFPVRQYEIVMDDKGNEVSREVTDSNGNPVLNREAVKQRDNLLDKLGSIKVPSSPLDMVINHFGSDMVAENTGRKRRIVQKDGKNVEQNIANAKEADVQAFQDGKKRIIIFSKAGGTGKSYHADKSAKNQQHRVHYLLQAGWQADAAVQGFGRSHRSNQASAPTFALVTTDLKGQMRFISTIAKRLDQLGALTKGQRQTGSQGLFSSGDNLESDLAKDVLASFYKDLVANKIEDVENGLDIIEKLGMKDKLIDKNGNFRNTASEVREITKFLNRILTLESHEQNAVFDAYAEKLQTATEKAMLEGTLDKGLENYKADKIELNEVKDIQEDKLTGAVTKYYSLTAQHKIKPLKFADIKMSANNFMGFYKNKNSGIVRAVFKTSSVTDQHGNISDNYKLTGQVKNEYIPQYRLYNWDKITENEAENIWNEEIKKLPEYSKEKLNLISGVVLPVWDKLPTENVRIYRVLTSDGELLIGRVIPDNMIDETLRQLGASRTKEKIETGALLEGIRNGDSVYLENGWRISQRRVSNENRIEIIGPDYKHNEILAKKGVFTERIQYQTRYFVPSEKDTVKILDEILKVSPVLRTESRGFGESDVRSFKGSTSIPESKWTAETSNIENTSNKKKETSPKGIGEIFKYISDKFGIPISTGNISQKGSIGIFKVTPKTIRTRISNSLPVISHEFGHYFDEKYNLSENEYINGVIDALDEDFKKRYSKKELPHEAVAEFIRVYLQSKSAARKISVDFYDDFVNALEQGKDLKEFNKVADYINEYMTAGFDERADAAIVSGKDKKQIRIDELKRKAYMEIVDSFAPIKDTMEYVKKSTDDKITGQNDGYVLATNSRNAAAAADYIIRHGMTDLNGNIDAGKSFIDCIKDVNPKNLNILDRYLVFKHSLEWLEPQRGKIKRVFADDTLQNTEVIRKSINAIEKQYPEMKQAAENLYEFQRNMMKNFYIDGGGMTEEMMNSLNEMYPNYAPFFRAVDKSGGKVKASFANQRVPIRRAKGSGLEIISPLESIVRNIEKAVKFGTRNRVMQVLANHADNTEGFGQFMESVPPDMIPNTINIGKYKDMLSEKLEDKLSADDFTSVTDMIDEVFGDRVTTFSPVANAQKHIVTVMENGESKYYQIHDPFLYKAVAELSPQQLTGALKVSQMILTPMKLLITQNNPIFSGTNALRDIQTAYKNSVVNNPIEFAGRYFQAFGEVFTKSDDYKRYKAIGGGHSSELSATRDLIKKTLRDVNMKDAGLARRLLSAILHPIDTIASVNDFVETLPRFSEFKTVREKTGDTQSAIYAADDLTTNFKRTGNSGRKINAAIMFNNASVQGLDKLLRSFKDATPDERLKRALKYVISALFMSAFLSWFNHSRDEEGYENLSAYTKNNFYTFSLGDGNFLKIPKARELAILDSFTERLIDVGFGDKEAFYDFGGYLANQLIPPMIPSDISSPQNALFSVAGSTAFGSFFDLMANKDFKGTPIVPKYMQDLENFEQYNEKTTLPAYWLGQMFNWSPVEVDHVISGYTGIIGQINKALLPMDGEQRDRSFGAKNKFVADSNYSTDILNKAYDTRDKARTEYKRNPTGENAIQFEKYSMIVDYISNMNKTVTGLQPEEKRPARNELLNRIRNWNTAYDENDKALIASYDSDSSDGYLITALPAAKLEYTLNKTKYTYTMTPLEYSEFIDEYLSEVEKQRKKALRSYSKSSEVLSDKLKNAKSEAAANIRERYKSKLRKKFEKIS